MNQFKRMQELAGIYLKENMDPSQSVTLHSSYYINQESGYEGFEWNDKFKNGMKSSKNQGANGESDGKYVILCSKTQFNMFGNQEEDPEEVDFVEVIFSKPLNQIYLDKDDHDLDEFGIDEDKIDECLDFIENISGEVNLSNLLQFGLKIDEDYSWYGTYVKEISSGDIKSIKKIDA